MQALRESITPETSTLFANVAINDLISPVGLPGPPPVCAQAGASVSLGAAGEMGLPSLPVPASSPAGRPAPPEARRGRQAGSWEVGERGGTTLSWGPLIWE